jgi:hypothetical protein
MIHNLKFLIFILQLLLITSCITEKFVLNRSASNAIEGKIIGNIDSVNISHENAFSLLGNGQVALKVPELTQFTGDFTVELERGEGLQFIFRTLADKFNQRPRIIFDYKLNGCKVMQNDSLITVVDSINANSTEAKLIKIENYAGSFKITVDCDTVFYGKTNLECTEYIIIKSLNNSKAFISGINFDRISDH